MNLDMIWVRDKCQHGDAIPLSQQTARCAACSQRLGLVVQHVDVSSSKITITINVDVSSSSRPPCQCCVLPRLIVSARSPWLLVVYHPHKAAVILVSLEQSVGIKGPVL